MKTTIEINGRIYDAQTGKMISTPMQGASSAISSKPNTTHKDPPSPLQRGVIMDGVSKKPVQHMAPNRSSIQRTVRQVMPATHPVQKSQTLHRKAVKKPNSDKPTVPIIHGTSANMESRVEQSATGRGLLLKRVPDVRLSRALNSSKSSLVSKFGRSNVEKPKLTTDLTVKTAPSSSAQPQAHQQSVIAPIEAPVITVQHHATHHSAPKKFVFEDHIKQANSHLLKPVKKESKRKRLLHSLKVSPKVASAAAAVFAIMLLGGFFAYQNVPAVSMRIAASKAGFEGKLPKSVPPGYSFNGPVQAEQDNIALTYVSNSDARKFIVTQKPSSWSSEALLTNYLLDSQFRYQAYKDKGLTVYIYNGSNATWVDKGVWFSVNGEEGSLSSEQLLDLASSI